MTRSYRRRAILGITAVAAALLPLATTPAFASTEVVAAPLPAPTGLSPADDPSTFPQTVRKDIVLSWNPVAGATGYRVQFGRDDTWSDTPTGSFDVVNTAFALPPGNTYQTYTWRVAALKGTAVGHWTSESTNSLNRAQFTKGWRQGPGSLSVTFTGAGIPTFSWTGVPGASLYKVAISPKPLTIKDFETAPDKGALCSTVRNRLTPVLDGGAYAEGVGAGSDACKIGLDPSTTYYWGVQGVDEAAGSDGGPEKTLTPVSSFVTPGAVGPSGVPAGAPTVTSLGSDPEGLCAIENAAPERAVCNDVPTIRWSPVAGAGYYYVTLSPDSLFQSVVDIIKTSATEWTTQRSWSEMSPSMAMYYDVQACSDIDPDPAVTNEVCNFSTARSFRKVSPRLSGLSTPPASGRFGLTWTSYAQVLAAAEHPSAGPANTASQDAKGYHLQVAKSDHPSFDTTVLDVTTDAPLTAAGRFTASGGNTYIPDSLADGSYLWRVQAVDGAGNKLPWSLSVPFTRDGVPPKLVSVTPSSNASTTGALKLTFSEPVTGVSASSVTVSPAAPMSVVVTSPTTATITPTSPLRPGATYTLAVTSAVQDGVGNTAVPTGPHFSVNPLVDDGNPAISYSSGWRLGSATNAVGGHFHSAAPTSSVHPLATMAFRGTGVSVTSCLGPANGYIDTYVDSVHKARTSTYRSYSGCGIKILGLTGLAPGQHTVRVIAVGTHVAASKGSAVALDAFTVTP